ncbi:MAG: flavodoxin family protein, partial [Clostridiales bacterium]|nr:flavodoxin family protein [Clostridiales bacterium]
MKVLIVNGSPHPKGCTYTALCEVKKELENAGIDTEILQIGGLPIRGCTACKSCRKGGSHAGKCVFDGDPVNEALEKATSADGFVFGSPVYYAGINGTLKSFLDRFFYAGSVFENKPGAAVVSCRRGGEASAFDQINKFFTISNMPVVSSQYWNMVHGETPDEVREDLEGMQTMRTLGRNMAWLLRCIEA